MKYIITIFALLLFCTVNSKVTLQAKNDSIENKITQLDKKVNSIENNYKDNLIQEYKQLNNLYNNGFTALLALFGIIFPFIFYFFQYKPAQDALKEAQNLIKKFDENFERSFEVNYKKNISRIIDESIESFELLEDQPLPTAILNLQNHKTEIFTKNQIVRLLNLLKREDIADHNKEPFANILSFQKADEIESYFVELLSNNPQNQLSIHGSIYFAINNKIENFGIIADTIFNDLDFKNLFSSLMKYNKTFAYNFLNYEKLLEKLNDEDIIDLCSFTEMNNYYKLQLPKLRKTALWLKYNSLIAETT